MATQSNDATEVKIKVTEPAKQPRKFKKKNYISKPPIALTDEDRRGPPKPKHLSTTFTTPINDPLWQNSIFNDSERGLTSEQAIKVFNADAAGYVHLVEMEYDALSDCDKFVTKTVSKSAYAYFHHILWWYKVALNAQRRGEASDAQERLIHFVHGYDIQMGSGAATYLMGMGDFTDATGVRHYLSAREPNQNGHFGQIDDGTHREYETLIAPKVSLNRVIGDMELSDDKTKTEKPLPLAMLPKRAQSLKGPEDAAADKGTATDKPPVEREIPESRTQDPDIEEGSKDEEDTPTVRQRETVQKPTVNLLGWHKAVPLNKNQRAEMENAIEETEYMDLVNSTYQIHRGLFEFVFRRLREAKRYKMAPLPKTTNGSVAQQLVWRPTNPTAGRYNQCISGEGKVMSRTQVPTRIVSAARVLCYRTIRATFETEEGKEVNPWSCLHYNYYEDVPEEWAGNRNTYLTRGLNGLYDYMPFATSIENRTDAVVEFLNKFKTR